MISIYRLVWEEVKYRTQRKGSSLMMVIGLLLVLEGVSYALIDVHPGNAWWSATYTTGSDEQVVEMPTPKVEEKAPTPQGTDNAISPAQGSLVDGAFAVPASQSLGSQAEPTTSSVAMNHGLVPGAVYIPDRIRIPAISLDAPIIPAKSQSVDVAGHLFEQWLAPDEPAVGWHPTSASLGVVGNTVLNGHHNVYGEVFKHLVDLKPGDEIIVSSGSMDFTYVIANKMILPEKYQTLEVRIANAGWLMPSQDERLTLVTCWPYTSNTHRLIIVAEPVAHGENLVRNP